MAGSRPARSPSDRPSEKAAIILRGVAARRGRNENRQRKGEKRREEERREERSGDERRGKERRGEERR